MTVVVGFHPTNIKTSLKDHQSNISLPGLVLFDVFISQMEISDD
jgi:hypothetical protein